MRKNFGAKPNSYPQAVYMIATYNEDGTANVMNAGWGGITGPAEITLFLAPEHRTTKNLLRTGALTISMGDAEHAAACDYLGLVSGENVADKLDKAGFSVSRSELVDAPIINELAVCLECKVKSYDTTNNHLTAEIINVSVDEAAMKGDAVDTAKIRPIIYDPFNACYREIGDAVEAAFSGGKKYM